MTKKIDERALPEIKRLAEQLREIVGEDDRALIDTLEGETDVMDLAGNALAMLDEAVAMEVGARNREAHYALRAKAMGERQERIRGFLVRLLDAADVKTLRHPLATITLRKGAHGVDITDEDALPEKYRRTETVTKIDRGAIRRDVLAGEDVPGATKTNAPPSIQIRST